MGVVAVIIVRIKVFYFFTFSATFWMTVHGQLWWSLSWSRAQKVEEVQCRRRRSELACATRSSQHHLPVLSVGCGLEMCVVYGGKSFHPSLTPMSCSKAAL